MAWYSHKMMAMMQQDKKFVSLRSTMHDTMQPKSVADYSKGMDGSRQDESAACILTPNVPLHKRI
jgi:hypothetical protein